MQAEATPKSIPHELTGTPGIYKRSNRYSVKWREEGRANWRSFATYEEACAFKRDYVIPYRDRRALPPTTIMPRKRDLGWIYFFQAGGEDQPVKIGWSKDPRSRYHSLTSASPERLELVALIPGSRAVEKMLHERFTSRRLRGEWFSREVLDDLMQAVASASAGV